MGSRDDKDDNVISLEEARRRVRTSKGRAARAAGAFNPESIDTATRDLHAAANTMLRFICLARDQLGLPSL